MGQHPQAYDELKKRLLQEYKKLVNTKKNMEEKAKTAPKAATAHNQSMDQSQDQVSSPHLNVYKPTFIINNSFTGDQQKEQSSSTDLKKYLKQQQAHQKAQVQQHQSAAGAG